MPMQRKTVTVVFCDVTGSTELGSSTDPEALRALLARYFERMKGIVESHGGSVEKFIGDAVMAVFGVPVSHEDDALRACRAAVEMRDALPELGIAGRIGVNTGEVVTGTEERLATGDAVNVAARLEQAAQPGEVLIGETTLGLVRAAVEVSDARHLELKGKAEEVPAWSLLAVTGEVERRFASPMVGRETELRRLRDAFQQAVHDRSCQLFTVLGSAGVGKSRLAAEFLGGLDARIVRGRCLSYGDGITYWPVVEILKQLGTLPEGDPARPLRSLLGESEISAPADEIAWGFRKLLEQEAQEQPLVCLLDDLHWGEETLLDLVEHIADLSRDAPLLLLCMARPELLERRPSWGGGKWNATTVLLEPLDAAETDQLIGELGGVDEELRGRILQAAEGNPLFLEEMLALVRDSGGAKVEVPPTIQALLAARLDQLDPAERSVLERGSVEGRTFHRGAVAALADGDGAVDQRLIALVRKELVRPDRAQLPGDDAYRFRHLLIRDAAYDALPKAMRADLHERFARWIEQHGADLVELDEILGYHLEQAALYRRELGMEVDERLRNDARRHLAAAGRRALTRQDFVAALHLIRRAVSLVSEEETDVRLEIDLANALFSTGAPHEALGSLVATASRAASAGDRIGELCARLWSGTIKLQVEPESTTAEFERLITEAAPELEAADDFGLTLLHFARGVVAHFHSRFDEEVAEVEQLRFHAERTELPHVVAWAFAGGNAARFFGSMPLADLLAWIDESEARLPDWRLLGWRSASYALLGRFEDARRLMSEFQNMLEERGDLLNLGSYLSQNAAVVELVAGDAAAAAALGERGCHILEDAGERGWLSTSACYYAQALYELGRLDEAETWAKKGSALTDTEDVTTQALACQVQAKVLARRGEPDHAAEMAHAAVTLADTAQSLLLQADARTDLAEVLELAGRREEATAALREALERYERKGALAPADRVRERLAALEPASA
ncbi:MAG TPA: adenylate/guanylate cyclase domain-containing protein [Gaiellaceae bacterium]|nr:adenylate/guanylate cyclase domain-containing protein [Gaiellaceae bacterium]